MRSSMHLLPALLSALTLLLPSWAAQAQEYPARTVTFVVPFAPGPAGDQLGRTLARLVADEAKQAVVVENKAGANGFIGVQHVAKSAPDGYTVLVTSSSTQVLNSHLFKKVPYDPIKDFIPLAPLGSGSLVMTVNGQSQIRNLAELIEAAKKNPGKITFGSHTAVTRLAGELFQQLAGVQLLHVPYKGLPAAVADQIGGQIQVLFPAVEIAAPHLKTGAMRAMGVTGNRRMAHLLPDVPTVEEAGVRGYAATFWYGAYVPAGTPPAVARRARELIVNASRKPEMLRFFSVNALEPFELGAEEFARFQLTELEKWGEVFRKAGINPE